MYLFYASIYTPEGADQIKQTVSVAYSTDGIHFEKYANNPVIARYPAEGGPDFRDPAVACVDRQILLRDGYRQSGKAGCPSPSI